MNNNSNSANQQNPNKGSIGTNNAYNKNQGNRGKQMNPIPNNANTPKPSTSSGKPKK
jgi:hypothetical protein